MEFIGYVDPGSGQLVWQVVLAAGIGLLFYLNKTREFMVKVVRRLWKSDSAKDKDAQ